MNKNVLCERKEFFMNNASTDKKKMSTSLSENMNYLNKFLSVDTNFDVVYRVIRIGGREACMYFIDGFCKDEMMQKMLQYVLDLK